MEWGVVAIDDYDIAALARIERQIGPPTADGCLLWLGADNGNGYGRMHYRGRADYPHRIVFRLLVGSLYRRLRLVDHRCGNRRCVNPQHLKVANDHTNGHHRVTINRNNTSGFPGVTREGTAWRAQVMVHRKYVRIGRAATAREAYELWARWQRENNPHVDAALLSK